MAIMRICILGISGLIGKHLVRAFLKNNDIELIAPKTREWYAEKDIDLVINVAGKIWGDESTVRKSLIDSTNSAICTANYASCPLIHIGSSLEYGLRSTKYRLNESAKLRPENSYARAKVECSLKVIQQAKKWVILRSGLVLSDEISESSLLGKIKFYAREYLSLYPVADETLALVRNPIDVQDLVDAILILSNHLVEDDLVCTVFNCGGLANISMMELANQILKSIGIHHRYTLSKIAPKYDLISTHLIENKTGWKPKNNIRNGTWICPK